MIHYNYIDLADAKPGDLLFQDIDEKGYFELSICIKAEATSDMKFWIQVRVFRKREFQSEIIDGKPTPALIARFTSPDELSACIEERKNQQLEIGSGSLVKVPGGIIQISEIKEFENNYYFGTMDWCEKWNGEYLQEYAYPTREQAETERDRLIAWLEEA